MFYVPSRYFYKYNKRYLSVLFKYGLSHIAQRIYLRGALSQFREVWLRIWSENDFFIKKKRNQIRNKFWAAWSMKAKLKSYQYWLFIYTHTFWTWNVLKLTKTYCLVVYLTPYIIQSVFKSFYSKPFFNDVCDWWLLTNLK